MPDEHKSESARYWEQHLLSWEASAYYKDTQRRATLWDRLSTLFRGDAMYVRMRAALDLLRPHLAGRTVLEVGCGSGRFALQLLEAGAAKVIGVDISEQAIRMAREGAAAAGCAEHAEFLIEDLIHPHAPLPRADVVTALGVIEYFDPATMRAFLGNLHTEHILLDFPDLSRRREFPTWPLRQIYIRVNRLPGVYLYSLDDFRRIAEPLGFHDLRLEKRHKFYYVTNLPPA